MTRTPDASWIETRLTGARPQVMAALLRYFRDLDLAYSANHLDRLSENTVQSIETSSLHIDLISDLKRINSHICSIAYPILESAGALAPSRLKALRAAPAPLNDHP